MGKEKYVCPLPLLLFVYVQMADGAEMNEPYRSGVAVDGDSDSCQNKAVLKQCLTCLNFTHSTAHIHKWTLTSEA